MKDRRKYPAYPTASDHAYPVNDLLKELGSANKIYRIRLEIGSLERRFGRAQDARADRSQRALPESHAL